MHARKKQKDHANWVGSTSWIRRGFRPNTFWTTGKLACFLAKQIKTALCHDQISHVLSDISVPPKRGVCFTDDKRKLKLACYVDADRLSDFGNDGGHRKRSKLKLQASSYHIPLLLMHILDFDLDGTTLVWNPTCATECVRGVLRLLLADALVLILDSVVVCFADQASFDVGCRLTVNKVVSLFNLIPWCGLPFQVRSSIGLT